MRQGKLVSCCGNPGAIFGFCLPCPASPLAEMGIVTMPAGHVRDRGRSTSHSTLGSHRGWKPKHSAPLSPNNKFCHEGGSCVFFCFSPNYLLLRSRLRYCLWCGIWGASECVSGIIQEYLELERILSICPRPSFLCTKKGKLSKETDLLKVTGK